MKFTSYLLSIALLSSFASAEERIPDKPVSHARRYIQDLTNTVAGTVLAYSFTKLGCSMLSRGESGLSPDDCVQIARIAGSLTACGFTYYQQNPPKASGNKSEL